jgi:hypothetical protein
MFSSSAPIRNRIQFLPKPKRRGRGGVGVVPRGAGGVLEPWRWSPGGVLTRQP